MNKKNHSEIRCSNKACGKIWTGLSRCHCHGCHETFNSVHAFDLHRTNQQCRNPAEIVVNKKTNETMSKNSDGYWITGKRPEVEAQAA